MRKIFVNLKRLHGMGIVHRDVKPVSYMPCSMFMATFMGEAPQIGAAVRRSWPR